MIDALFEQARASGDDDGPRLVLADALMERGDPRGEFIQVQCELARARPGLAAAALRRQERELFEAHAKGWGEGLPAGSYTFARGFIAEIVCRMSVWSEHHQRIRASQLVAPLEKLRLFRQGADEAAELEVVSGPSLAGIERLELGYQIHDVPTLELLANPAIRTLRGLKIEAGWIDEPVVRALAASPHVAGLRDVHIDTVATPALTGAALAAVFDAPQLAACRLRFDATSLGDEAIEDLAAAGTLARRREWLLQRWYPTPAGVRRLVAACPPDLQRIGLPCHLIGDEGARVVAGAPSLQRLEELDLTGVISEYGDEALYVGNDGLRALCDAAALPGLRAFRFGFGDAVTPAGASRLWSAPWLPGLRHLELLCKIDPGQLADAVRAGKLDRVETLTLPGLRDAAALFAEVELPQLRRLELQTFGPGPSPAVVAALQASLGTIVEVHYPRARWSPTLKLK